MSWLCYLSLPVRVGRPSSSLAGRKSRGMSPRDESKFNLAVRMSSRSSGGDTGHMIVKTSFMLFGCAKPASQAIVRSQVLYNVLSVGKHTGHTTTISLDHSTDDNEAHSSRSQFTANRKVRCAAESRCCKGQGRAGQGRAGQGKCIHHSSAVAVHCFCPHSQW